MITRKLLLSLALMPLACIAQATVHHSPFKLSDRLYEVSVKSDESFPPRDRLRTANMRQSATLAVDNGFVGFAILDEDTSEAGSRLKWKVRLVTAEEMPKVPDAIDAKLMLSELPEVKPS